MAKYDWSKLGAPTQAPTAPVQSNYDWSQFDEPATPKKDWTVFSNQSKPSPVISPPPSFPTPRGVDPYLEFSRNPASIGLALAGKLSKVDLSPKIPNDPAELYNIPIQAMRGAVSAQAPVKSPQGDLDVPKTILKSAGEGIMYPEKTPSFGAQFQNAYPKAPWLLSGLAGTAIDYGLLHGLGQIGGVEKTGKSLLPFSGESQPAPGENIASAARRDPSIFAAELKKRAQPEVPITPDEASVRDAVKLQHENIAAQAAMDPRPTAEDHQAIVQGLEAKLNYQHDPVTGEVVRMPETANAQEIAQAEVSKQALENGDFKPSTAILQDKAKQAMNDALSAHRTQKYAKMPAFTATEALDKPIGQISEQNNLAIKRFQDLVFDPLSNQALEATATLEQTEDPAQRIALRDTVNKLRKTLEEEATKTQDKIKEFRDEIKKAAITYAKGSLDLTKSGWARFESDLDESLSGENLSKNWQTTLRNHLEGLIQKYQPEAAKKGQMKNVKTVYARVIQLGRINPESIKLAGYNVDEDFRQNGLGFLLSKSGASFGRLASQLVGNNELAGYKEGDSETEALMSALKKGARLYGKEKESPGFPEEGRHYSLAPTFYSALERAIEKKMPNAATPDQIRGILSSGGVPKDQLDWVDVDSFLAGKDKVSKTELLNFIRANDVKVQEVEKDNSLSAGDQADLDRMRKLVSDPDKYNALEQWQRQEIQRTIRELESNTKTKFSQYQLPAGENYKELLLMLPKMKSEEEFNNAFRVWMKQMYPYEFKIYEKNELSQDEIDGFEERFSKSIGEFKSSHFDEPNILAHIRFNERADTEGKKVLFIEEIQSDWHQKGRKEGYGPADTSKWRAEETIDEGRKTGRPYKPGESRLYKVTDDRGRNAGTWGADNAEEAIRMASDNASNYTSAVPNAPFKKTWHELALKRMLRYAAENGFDKIAWTTGEQQAERYDLSKMVDKITWQSTGNLYDLGVWKNGERLDIHLPQDIPADKLPDYVGKDVAKKIVETEHARREGKTTRTFIDAEDLKVGGEAMRGMKGFYDQIIPTFLNRYAKKWGGRTVTSDIVPSGEKLPFARVHSLEITPSMKKSVLKEGQRYKKGVPTGLKRAETIAIGRALFEKLAPKNVSLILEGNLETLEGKKALGWFQQYGGGRGLIKIDPSVTIETYHHELGHAVLNLTYEKSEREALLDEVKTAWNLESTRLAEEAIMDEAYNYQKWTESGKDPNAFFGRRKFEGRTFSDKIKNFIQSIAEAIKRFFNFAQDPANMEKLKQFYKSMYAGRRENVPTSSEKMPAKFKEAPVDWENPIMKLKEGKESVYIKSLQEDLRRIIERIKAGQKEPGLERRKEFLIKELNRQLSPQNAFQAGKELNQFISQVDFFDTEMPPGGVPLLGKIDPKQLRDIHGIKTSLRDVFRNFKEVFQHQYRLIKPILLDPLDDSRGKFWDMQKAWANELEKTIVKRLGIKPGSKEAFAVRDYGEGEVKYDESVESKDEKTGKTKILQKSLVAQFGKEKANKIVEADAWFRVAYDDILERVNSSIAQIYPGQSDKLIPRMKNYYRHGREFSNLAGLLNIFDTPANIASKLAGISETTKPLSRWLSFGQERLTNINHFDAVKGFLDYIKAASYATHMSPNIPRFRQLAKELRIATAKDPLMKEKIRMLYEEKNAAYDALEKEEIQNRIKALTQKDYLNTFISFLDDFAGDLAGKTNPYLDRDVQKIMGRKPLGLLTWVNNRVKANVILGNAGSAVAQLSNIPQVIAKTKLYFVLGMGDSIVQILHPNHAEQNKSIFLKSRYGDSVYNKFSVGFFEHSKDAAKWFMTVLDEVATRAIWNSFYEMSKARRASFEDHWRYADEMTRRMVGGRGVGEVPLLQKSKVFQLGAPFMLEVQNLWWEMGDNISEKDFSFLVVYIAAAYLFNSVMEKVIGHRVIFDPANAIIDASQPNMKVEQRLGRLIGEVLSNVPFGGWAESKYPEYGTKIGDYQLPTRKQFFGQSDTTRYGKGLLEEGVWDAGWKLLPSWGGNQLKKAYTGNKALKEGYVSIGKKRIPVDDTATNRVIATAFGKYAMPEVKEYFKNREKKTQENYMKKSLKHKYTKSSAK